MPWPGCIPSDKQDERARHLCLIDAQATDVQRRLLAKGETRDTVSGPLGLRELSTHSRIILTAAPPATKVLVQEPSRAYAFSTEALGRGSCCDCPNHRTISPGARPDDIASRPHEPADGVTRLVYCGYGRESAPEILELLWEIRPVQIDGGIELFY